MLHAHRQLVSAGAWSAGPVGKVLAVAGACDPPINGGRRNLEPFSTRPWGQQKRYMSRTSLEQTKTMITSTFIDDAETTEDAA